MEINVALLNIIIFSSFIFVSPSVGREEYNCVYNLYVKTGSIMKAGTDSKITVELFSKDGNSVRISDIESWGGLMGLNYDYFERDNLDIFSGRGPCLYEPVCAVKLISDGSGPHHAWYCDYVDIATTGSHVGCAKEKFKFQQWLASDAPPYELTAVRNNCPYDDLQSKGIVQVVSQA